MPISLTGGDQTALRNQFLYPLNDPTTAFSSALRGMGINPNRSNPFVSQLQRSAMGARNAFLANKATTGSDRAYATEDPSAEFQKFLDQNLRSGSLIGRLREEAGRMPGTIQAIRDYENQLNTNDMPTSLNPYMTALRDIYAADNGKGAMSAYASMRAPGMGSLAPSYTRALSDFADSAIYRFGQNGSLTDDVWTYMFQGGMF
jgi:hypothetical protein